MALATSAFDYAATTGRLGNRRRLIDIPANAGAPDGMTIDADQGLWVALYGGSPVRRYTPDGRLDATVSFPATDITCPIFGGPGFNVLCVTCARDGLDDRRLAAHPHAGALFAVDSAHDRTARLRFAG